MAKAAAVAGIPNLDDQLLTAHYVVDASIEHARGVWGGMLSRVLVGSQVAAWGLWGGKTPLAGAFSRR